MNTGYYFDTSALVKNYFEENGSARVKELLQHKKNYFTSTLTYAEVYAAFYFRFRRGLINNKTLKSLTDNFEMDWATIGRIALNNDVCALLPKLISQFPLRGADATHMASYAFLMKRMKITFVASDKVLLNAIEDFGGKWINPEEV